MSRLGHQMHELAAVLYPMHRCITGNGVRQTLEVLKQYAPLEVHEVASGTQVFDWRVPQEWNIRDAYIKDASGKRVVDYHESNLHVVNYSLPVKATLSWEELKGHLVTLPEHPDWIPYRTCYFENAWAFCLSHKQFLVLDQLGNRQYEVCIDSTLRDGSLTYGEIFLAGASSDEVLISCHVCHPSLANDNLSGIAVAVYLARHLAAQPRRYSYRFIFIPATIGAITWLAINESHLAHVKHGLIFTVMGDSGHSTYKKSRRGNAEIDRAVQHVLKHSGQPYEVRDYEPYGYDERQFCSPGIDLPMGCLMRTPDGQYPQYHTSADNLELLQPQSLEDSLAKSVAVTDVLENNRFYLNTNPKCEPQLGNRGLYQAYGRALDKQRAQQATLWVLNLSDGKHSLLDIAERSGLDFHTIRAAADALRQADLLKECNGASTPVTPDGKQHTLFVVGGSPDPLTFWQGGRKTAPQQCS